MQIRRYQDSDWSSVWSMIEKVFSAGDTYPYSPQTTEQEAYKIWIEAPHETYVATAYDDEIVGTYYIKPNQPGLGSHVCNCGYIVSEAARGKGVASKMCKHSQQAAVDAGYRAMQFNLVVSTNEGAIHLWKKMGFKVVGELPKAFNSKKSGYVDALVMYKQLRS
ncbi:MAG: GNAT family N-acetyltransferase [Candidatus Thiodiazotropha sp.]